MDSSVAFYVCSWNHVELVKLISMLALLGFSQSCESALNPFEWPSLHYF